MIVAKLPYAINRNVRPSVFKKPDRVNVYFSAVILCIYSVNPLICLSVLPYYASNVNRKYALFSGFFRDRLLKIYVRRIYITTEFVFYDCWRNIIGFESESLFSETFVIRKGQKRHKLITKRCKQKKLLIFLYSNET